MISTVQIQQANQNDLTILQKIGAATFYETFAPFNSKENMEHYLNTHLNTTVLSQELTNPQSQFFLALINDEVIGYLKVNHAGAQTEQVEGNSLEIERIYVVNAWQGNNVGRHLFNTALEIARRNRCEYIWLGVWEENSKAIRFYKKNGFIPFDTHTFVLGSEIQTDIMMKLPLKKLL